MSRRSRSRAARTRRRAAERADRKQGQQRMRIPDHVRALDPKKRQEDPRDHVQRL